MKIGILGSGIVGQTIGTKLVKLGHEVKLGSRTATNDTAQKWVSQNGERAAQGTFAEAALFGEMVVLCVRGDVALAVVKAAGAENLQQKTLIDICNPLDASGGGFPTLIPALSNTTSLGETIQAALPKTNVVKTLNVVNCEIMVEPQKTTGSPTMFMAGNDAKAKEKVKALLTSFGWEDIIDLGDITAARGTEMLLPIWLRTMQALNTMYFGFKIIRKT